MTRLVTFMRRHVLFFLVGLIYLYLAMHIFGGQQGVFRLAGYEREIAQLQDDIARAKSERLDLEMRVDQLRPDQLSPDSLEIIARRDLGYSQVNDLVIILDE